MYMESGGVVNWVNANSEQIQNVGFQCSAGYLNIDSGRFAFTVGIGGNKPLIRMMGTTVDSSIGTITYDGNQYNGFGAIYTTTGTEYPRTCPNGFIIQRYTSSAFTPVSQTEYTTRVYRNLPVNNTFPQIIDDFAHGFTTPFGELGWTITNIGGSVLGRFPGGGLQSGQVGVLEIATNSSSGSDVARVCPVQPFFTTNSFSEWEMTWLISFSDVTKVKMRCGLYTLDGSAVFIPATGIGITFTAGVDTNIQFETVASNVSTKTDTGVAITTLNSYTTVKIRRVVNSSAAFYGYTCQIGTNAETTITTVVSSVSLVPAFFMGSATSNFATGRIDRFTLRF